MTSPAMSTPIAMARSSPAPPLRSPEGARFTVIRLFGHSSSLECTAARTRSRDSRQASSGRPTIWNPGRPGPTWTSTSTGCPVTPSNVADVMAAITGPPEQQTVDPDERVPIGVGRGRSCGPDDVSRPNIPATGHDTTVSRPRPTPAGLPDAADMPG